MSAGKRPALSVCHSDALASEMVARSERARFERDAQAIVPERKQATPPPPKTPPVPRRRLPKVSAASVSDPRGGRPTVPDGAVIVSREEWGAISRMITVVTDEYAKTQRQQRMVRRSAR